MKKVSLKIRIKIYKEALKRIKNNSEEFMCNAIIHILEEVTGTDLDNLNSSDIIKEFPEFIKQKPKDSYESMLWFFNELDSEKKRKRIIVLTKSIKLANEKLSGKKK